MNRYIKLFIVTALFVTSPLSQGRCEPISSSSPFLQLGIGLSVIGETGHREHFAQSYAVALTAGWRWKKWGAFLQAEPAFWRLTDPSGQTRKEGALNVGVGGEYRFAEGRLRTAMSVGPSRLIKASGVDQVGSMGVYFQLQPVGVRWSLGERFIIGFHPIDLVLIIPVLDGIPLIEVEYRTTFIGEYLF